MFIALIKDTNDTYDDWTVLTAKSKEELDRQVDSHIDDNMAYDDEYTVLYSDQVIESTVKYEKVWTNKYQPATIKPVGPEI